MRYAFNLANFGAFADVELLLGLAQALEAAGWDAVFLWDHVNWPNGGPHADPWVALGAIAHSTSSIQIGTMVTPISRRRPWKLAREALTLDALSKGRFILGAGNGLWVDEFDALGDEPNMKIRAEMLEEGLELLRALWRVGPVKYDGKHYNVETDGFGPTHNPTGIPIWLGGMWPNKNPFRRAAKYDGALPIPKEFGTEFTPDQAREIVGFVNQCREIDGPMDFGFPLNTTNDAEADIARAIAFESAGATWWIDSSFPGAETIDDLFARIQFGPPRA
jgi:alkanesulfonate monooxygenase SsuD/methylene tetrahydromethanopterin reductase-like flavin-dependent oxidoreductase (luciferase family)